jgi:hypothetical protein
MLRDLLPVATLLIGYLTKSASDYIENRRAHSREREARDSARKDRLFEQRISFQRETLLALQDELMQLIRDTAVAHHHNVMTLRQTGKLGLLPNDLDEGYRIHQATISKLVSRVLDRQVRDLVERLRTESVETVLATSESAGDAFLKRAGQSHDQLNSRIGEVIRSLDDGA